MAGQSEGLTGALTRSLLANPDESKSLKWKAALLVGVGAVALAGGAALLIYALNRRRRRTPASVASKDEGKVAPPSTAHEGNTTAQPPATTSQSSLERARALKQQGNEFYKQQKFDEAIRCYDEAIKVCPSSKKEDLAIFHQNLAAVYDMMATKSTDGVLKTSYLNLVVENCTRAFENNPRYVKALTRRLKVYDALGRKKDAILDVTRVLVLDESQGRLLSQTVAKLLKDFGYKQAKEKFPKLPPLAPTKHLINTYFSSFTWSDDLSETELKKIWCEQVKVKSPTVEATPVPDTPPDETPDAANSQSNDSENDTPREGSPVPEQINGHTNANGSAEDSNGFYEQPFVKASIVFQSNNFDGIVDLLTEAVTSGNSVFIPHALLLRGAFYSLWREDEKGLKDLQNVSNIQGLRDEMYTNALVKRAGIYAGLGETEKCHTCLTKALAIDSKCADVYIYRGRLVLEAETEDQTFTARVIEDLEKGLSLCPSSPHAAYLLGSAYHRIAGLNQSMQVMEKAKAKFEEAVQKFPNFADGLLLYSMFLQDLNNFEEANDMLNKVIKLQPENPIAHFSLGLLSFMYRQDMTKAVECMERAIATDSSCVQAYTTLATIEMQRGNVSRAMELYDKAIQYSRSEIEMSQAFVSREVVNAQHIACSEYNVSPAELASRAYSGGGGGGGGY